MTYTMKQKRNYCLGAVGFCEDADVFDHAYMLENPMDPDWACTYGAAWKTDVDKAFDYLEAAQRDGDEIDKSLIYEALHEGEHAAVGQPPIVKAFIKVWLG